MKVLILGVNGMLGFSLLNHLNTKILKLINEKIDCGNIIEQTKVQIDKNQNKANLQAKLLEKCIPAGNVEYKSEYIPDVDDNEHIVVESDGL